MSNSPAIDRWFDLAPLGFPGWQHNSAFRVSTNTNGGHQPLCVEIRMTGSDFPVRLFDDGGGLFKVIKRHVEAVEALIAKQDQVAA